MAGRTAAGCLQRPVGWMGQARTIESAVTLALDQQIVVPFSRIYCVIIVFYLLPD